MNTPKDGGPAFPVPVSQPFGDGWLAVGGMTMRQWYKGHAVQGLLAAYGPHARSDKDGIMIHESVIACAAYLADALLAEDAEHARKEQK